MVPRRAAEPDDDDREGSYRFRDALPAQRGAALLLAALAVLLMGIVPSIFLIRDAVHDPVYAGLDSLSLPGWADLAHEDLASGSRYCMGTCRLRERVWQSGRAPAETDAAFELALRRAGWLKASDPTCPKGEPGTYTCWQHDQYVLDLWTRDATCTTSQAGGPTPGPSDPKPSNEVDVLPSTGTSPGPARTGPVTAACPLSQVTAKVGNRVDPLWHK